MAETLTPRQQREREYYEEYVHRIGEGTITFGPVLSAERRPWNSYWFTQRTIADAFRSPDQRLLEIGSGDGGTSIRYAKVGYEVWGLDISESFVAKAERNAARSGLADRTHFSTDVAEKLPFDDGMFDVVTGIDILHHVDIPATMAQVHRVLKPGGVAVFREWIEVFLLDTFRKTRLMRLFFPKEVSFEDQITEDEHPLTPEEMAAITGLFPDHEAHRFGMLSRIRKIRPAPRGDISCQLEKLDHAIFRALPFTRNLGCEVVLVLKREHEDRSA